MSTIIDFDETDITIFDVPMSMYHISPDIYEPKLVRIGAMQKPKCDTMERYKSAIAKRIMKKYFDDDENKFFVVEEANMYETRQMAIDAAFIAWYITNENDFKFIEYNFISINLDLILMKNQMPLKLVMKILDKICNKPEKLFRDLFEALSPFNHAKITNADNIHLLEYFYKSMIPETKPENGKQCQKLFSASKLRSYGIKFKAITERPTFTSIQFDKTNRTLALPTIVMHHERTEIVLKNLIAYEIVYQSTKTVKEYALFMDYLIDTVKDLQILAEAGIIENKMGSDENAIRLWNTICIGTTTEFCSDLSEIIDELHDHCHRFKYRLLKESYDKFFSRPWLIVSLITAIIITAATIIQTIYSAMSYYPH
jgi:uncharacterized protein DUF247